MSNWKESQAVRKVRVNGSRKIGTMVERDFKRQQTNARSNWRELMDENGWDDAELHLDEGGLQIEDQEN